MRWANCARSRLSPGAYVSESNFLQADWLRAYWGANYERLRTIKA
jgi:hypothetical protein